MTNGSTSILPALRILCLAFLEIDERKTGDAFWCEKAKDALKSTWWLKVLDVARLPASDGMQSWGDIRKKDKINSIELLKERIIMESNCIDMDSVDDICKLIAELCEDTIEESKFTKLVENANQGLKKIMG